ncbi:MAG TPA: YciI family protein [Chloroflexota bacterium]|nr:YciI family protein [Chloroflexota bacterium]
MSKYMVLLYAAESALPQPGTPEFDAQNAAYGAVYEDFAKRGAFVGGDPLTASSAATSVRIRNGQRQDTPGAAANTPEQLIGYYVLECKDAKEAADLAATIPAAKQGTVEVRPVFAM